MTNSYTIKGEDLDAVSRLVPFLNQMADCFVPVCEEVAQHPDLLEVFAAVFAGRACSFGQCNGADAAVVHLAVARLLAVGTFSAESPVGSSSGQKDDATVLAPLDPRIAELRDIRVSLANLERLGAVLVSRGDERSSADQDFPNRIFHSRNEPDGDARADLKNLTKRVVEGSGSDVFDFEDRCFSKADDSHDCSFRCDEGAGTPVDRSVEGRADDTSAGGGPADSVADRPTPHYPVDQVQCHD